MKTLIAMLPGYLGKLNEDTNILNAGSFTLADLQTEYESLLEKNSFAFSPESRRIALVDFCTGTPLVRKYESVLFQLVDLVKTKIVEKKNATSKMEFGKQTESEKQHTLKFRKKVNVSF